MATIILNYATRLHVLPEFDISDQRKWAVQIGPNSTTTNKAENEYRALLSDTRISQTTPRSLEWRFERFLAYNAAVFWATRRLERQRQFTKPIDETCNESNGIPTPARVSELGQDNAKPLSSKETTEMNITGSF